MLTPEEFKHLQQLSCIQLSPDQEQLLGNQLLSIVDFLGKLKNIHIDQDILAGQDQNQYDRTLIPKQGVVVYQDADELFQNVHHQKINKSIVIKSVMED